MRIALILLTSALFASSAQAAHLRVPPYHPPPMPPPAIWPSVPWATSHPWPAPAGEHAVRHKRHKHKNRRDLVHVAHKSPLVRSAERTAPRHPPQHSAHQDRSQPSGHALVTVPTAAGPITVFYAVADKFRELIALFAAAGYTPRHVGCFAAHGHVKHSLHHSGQACDFDQEGWNATAPFMYTEKAHAIIASVGLRDGCDFRHPRKDCGHVDVGTTWVRSVSARARFAPLRHARASVTQELRRSAGG